ncbi:hypothetical protein FP026_28285 [Rhizobium tropici]|uniref:Uncharacterized protein n=1 Tax=Rhizobium tropici TaxID=398 RepID=A0A5B0VN16_RHITR|nr:hypothetical protein FP026_28285 [Rhizobium tropici]
MRPSFAASSSRAFPLFFESRKRSIFFFLYAFRRKTAAHFSWKCSKRDALRGGSPRLLHSVVLFSAPVAASRAKAKLECRTPYAGRPIRSSDPFHRNSPFLPLAELRRAKKICPADRICRTETVSFPQIKSIRESSRRGRGPAARRGPKDSCALCIFPDREQHRFRVAGRGRRGPSSVRRRAVANPIGSRTVSKNDASRQEFANLFMGFSLSSSSAGY